MTGPPHPTKEVAMASRFLLVSAVAAAVAGLGGAGPAAPTPESKLSSQDLADRFLEIHAILDKPGRVLPPRTLLTLGNLELRTKPVKTGEPPVYRLGEPVVVELELKNKSADHVFWVAGRARGHVVGTKMWSTTSGYMLTAKRKGRVMPPTAHGKGLQEYLINSLLEPVAYGWSCVDRLPAPTKADAQGNTPIAFPARAVANVLCDMTEAGEYELEVTLFVKVRGGNPPMDDKPAIVVVRDKALRLLVTEYSIKID